MNPAAIAILVNQLPILIACAIGVITSLVLFNRRRISAAFALGGFVVLLGSNLSNVFITNWLMNRISEGVDSKELGYIVGIGHFISSFTIAIALILLLVAVFVKSGKSTDP